MALVTVQRSPSPSDTPDTLSSDLGAGLDLDHIDSSVKSPQRSRSLSESYLSFKGAALILPQSECLRTITKGTHADIQVHLQSMFYLLRPQDTIKMAIKLESADDTLIRYMAVVTTIGVQDTEESVIVGVDIQKDEANIGLVLPVWGDMAIKLDGDGGFHITSNQTQYIFKPVSVQAMWSAWQCLNKVRDVAAVYSYYHCGLTHTWVQYYKVTSSQNNINLWNLMEDLETQRPDVLFTNNSNETEKIEANVKSKLKEVMMTVDLEEVTSKFLRTRLEEELNMSLQEHKHFIDQEMIYILRQMDSPSEIFPYLYLGSEWNASNLEELQKNGVGFILNVTREIDNFFPGMFHYKNIRVYDVDESDLLRYWEETYRFINKAREKKSKVLVHCKMGVSRSASTVISFAMKDNGWSLDEAHKYVKSKRNVIKPNEGFMKQLKTYEGILGASNQRHNKLWRSTSAGNLEPPEQKDEDLPDFSDVLYLNEPSSSYSNTQDYFSLMVRSWSPQDGATDILLKASNLASRESSEDENSLDVSFDNNDLDTEPIQFLLEADPDTSSQSIDEWDEAFHEEDSVTASTKTDILVPDVILISHRPRDHTVEPEQDKVESESEGEYGMEDDKESRHVAGTYDVTMLRSAHDDALEERVQADSNGNGNGTESLLHLHPDVILEHALTRQRRQLVMTKLLRYHNRHGVGDKDQAQVIRSSVIASAFSASGCATRVKPDDFWIKEGPPIIQDPDQEPTTAESSPEEVDNPTPESAPEPPETEVETPTTKESPVGEEQGAIKPYIKEDIPWSPGTVRRHAQDLECRMTTAEVPLSDASASPPSTSLPSSRSESTSAPPVAVGVPPGTPPPGERRPDSLPMDTAGSPAATGSDHSDCLSASTLSTPLDSPSQSPRSERPRQSSCIYESEDIPLEPGHVLRTKLEIEQRERSSSYIEMSPDKESRPVQRSSSYKEDRRSTSRSRFDRSSERRKTCLPVLHTSFTDLKALSASKSLEDVSRTSSEITSTLLAGNAPAMDSAEEEATRQQLQLGDEVVEIERGKVRRRTLDYEVRALEDPSSKDDKDDGETVIPQGSVKQTKQEIEEKYGNSGKPTKQDGNAAASIFIGLPDDQDGDPPEPIIKLFQAPQEKGTEEVDSTSVRVEVEDNNHLDVNRTELKHSHSTPQLSDLTLAYPGEDEITWSVGTVRQHREAFESKAKEVDLSPTKTRPEDTTGTPPRVRLSDETLTLIREIGTAWSRSPKVTPKEGSAFDYPSGPGMVKRFTDQIQGQSASKSIQRKLVIIENRSKVTGCLNIDVGSNDSASSPSPKSMARSSSMRETSPRLREASDSSVGRSVSLRSQPTAKDSMPSTSQSRSRDGVGRKGALRKALSASLDIDGKQSENTLEEMQLAPGGTIEGKTPGSFASEQVTNSESLASSPNRNSDLIGGSKATVGASQPKGKLYGETVPSSPPRNVSHAAMDNLSKSPVGLSSVTASRAVVAPTKEAKLQIKLATVTPSVIKTGSSRNEADISESCTPQNVSCKTDSTVEPATRSDKTVVDSKIKSSENRTEVLQPSATSTVESSVKNLRGIFEGQKQESVSPSVSVVLKCESESESKTEGDKDSICSSTEPMRQRSKSSPESVVSKDDETPPRVMLNRGSSQAEPTEVQQIVSSLESAEKLLDPHIKEKAIKALFKEKTTNPASVSELPDPESDGESTKRHQYRHSTSSVTPTPFHGSRRSPSSSPEVKGFCRPSPPRQRLPVRGDPDTDTSHKVPKFRKLHGKSHPLSKLASRDTAPEAEKGSPSPPAPTSGRTKNPIYNTL